MRISELLRKLQIPMILLSAMFVVGTFAACGAGKRTDRIGWFLSKFDLRREANPAVWFESVLMLYCGLSFVPMHSAVKHRTDVKRVVRHFLFLCAIGCVAASADEMLMLHEQIGWRMDEATKIFENAHIYGQAVWWVILLGPFLLAAAILALLALRSIILRVPAESHKRRRVWMLLGGFVVAVPAVLLLEVLAENVLGLGRYNAILTCFEESFELVALLCLAACNTIIVTELERLAPGPAMNPDNAATSDRRS